MTLRHFRIFLTVCETGSMTLAARRLGMSQPPVSQSIAELERQYGVQLFERIGRTIRITALGETLRVYAVEVLRLVDEAQRGLLALQDAGSLRVGASMTVGTALLPVVMEELRARTPRIRLHIVVENTAGIIRGLQAADLDIGFVEGTSDWPGMLTEVLYEDELVLICGPGDEFAGAGPILPSRLDGRSFVVREEGSGTRETFATAMAEADLRWEEVAVVNGAEAIIELVSHGIGLSFVSRLLARRALEAGTVVAVPVEGLTISRKFRLVQRRDKQVTETMTAFAESCRLLAASMAASKGRA